MLQLCKNCIIEITVYINIHQFENYLDHNILDPITAYLLLGLTGLRNVTSTPANSYSK